MGASHRPLIVVFAMLVPLLVAPTDATANFAKALDAPCDHERARRCFADSIVHTWNGDLGPRNDRAVRATLYGSYNTSSLTITEKSGHPYDLDVWYEVDTLPGYYGLTSCEGGNGTHFCTHWHVTFNPDNGDQLIDNELRSLACHETGHTVGLMHPEINSHGYSIADARFACMRTAGNMNPWDIYLGQHNVSHIDNFYSA